MRVAFVLPEWPWAPVGGFKVVYKYASDLARMGHDVTLCHTRQNQFRGVASPAVTSGLRPRMSAVRDRLKPPRLTWFPLDSRVVLRLKRVLTPDDMPDADFVVATNCWSAPFVASLPARC